MGVNEQFLGVLYKKVAALSSTNTFLRANTFKGDVTFSSALTAAGSLLFPLVSTTLTIATGAVTAPAGTLFLIDTEGAGGTDDLDTINGFSDGRLITLRAANAARTVVIKHNTGNIVTFDGGDITLDETRKVVDLLYDDNADLWVAKAGGVELLDEDDFVSDSATKGATQQSIKAYVDSVLGGGLIDLQVFTASGTWTKPSGTNSVIADVVGGGGGGGAKTTDDGSAGGTSSFGAHLQATGGSGGEHGGSNGGATNILYGYGGAGGVGTLGDINLTGGNGASGHTDEAYDASESYMIGGPGGASMFGAGSTINGAHAFQTEFSAPNASNYGSGGAGAHGGTSVPQVAGGGGAGGYTRAHIDTGLGATETVTIGAGGDGGDVSGAGDGGDGADGVVVVYSYS